MSDAGRGMPLLSGPPPPTESTTAEIACRKCNKEFNLIFARARRCNHCGYSYCHSCSDYQALMPRSGVADTGYDAMHVCAFCIEYLTITAAGRTQLKAMSLAKLRKYITAYNLKTERVVEKDDLIDAIISARGSNGCVSKASESHYRKYSVPNKVPPGRPRGLFSRQQGPSSNTPIPPTPPRRQQTREFARPDLAPDFPTPEFGHDPPHNSQSYPQQQQQQPPYVPRHTQPPPQQQYNPPPQPPPRPQSSYSYGPPPQSGHSYGPPPNSGYAYAPPPNHGYSQGPPPHPGYPYAPPPGPPPQGYGYTGAAGYGPSYTQAPPPPPPESRPQPQAHPHPPPQNHQSRPPPPRPASTRPTQNMRPPSPPPRPRAASSAPPPNLDELLTMTPESIGSLSIGALKAILFTNHVNAGQILEKSDLVQKVLTLVEDEKAERERQRRAEEREEMERMQREQDEREEAEQAHTTNVPSDYQDGTSTDSPPIPPKSPPKSAPPKAKGSASTLERTGLCVICQDEEANIAIVDCGHMAMCRGCSDLIMSSSKECPLCRTRIVTEQRLLRIFKT